MTDIQKSALLRGEAGRPVGMSDGETASSQSFAPSPELNEWKERALRAEADCELWARDYHELAESHRIEIDTSAQRAIANYGLFQALKLLVADVADYDAWARPVYALEQAQEAMRKFDVPIRRSAPTPNPFEPRFSTRWEREDYEREKRGEKPLGPR